MNYIEVDYGDRICKYSFSKLYFHTGCSYSKAYISIVGNVPMNIYLSRIKKFLYHVDHRVNLSMSILMEVRYVI